MLGAMVAMVTGANQIGTNDVTAPTLSSQSMDTLTNEGGVPTVTTDESSGKLYYAVLTDAGSASDAQIKAGTGGNIVEGKAGNKDITADGVNTFVAVTGLDAATAYEVVFLHTDAWGNDSDQVEAGFTTEA